LVVLFKFAYKDAKTFYSFPLWLVLLYPLNQVCISLGQIAPLFMGVSVTMTVFLNYTQPLWTIMLSALILKEKLHVKDAVAALIMFAGLFLLLQPFNGGLSELPVFGCLVALLGGLSMALWIMFNAHFVRKGMPPLSLTFFSSIYAPLFIGLMFPLILYMFPQPDISGFDMDKPLFVWGLIIVYSLGVYVGTGFLFYSAAKKVPNVCLGLTLLLEPVTATLLDACFLGTVLSWNILLGGGLIMAANAFLILKNKQNQVA